GSPLSRGAGQGAERSEAGEGSRRHCGELRRTTMPLPNDVDATTPKYLRDKYAIVGVGETTYTRGSGRTTRALGSWAVRNAMLDAGRRRSEVDGMLPYQGGDSTSGTFISADPARGLNFYWVWLAGGRSTEPLVG